MARQAMRQRAIEDLEKLSDRGEAGYPEFDDLHAYIPAHPPRLD